MQEEGEERLVPDDEILLRRVNLFTVSPEGDGYRINSGAFTTYNQTDGGLSVSREVLISEAELLQR